ncbi:MAG TPA: hypothetical protein VHG72_01555 [Polyangia bacterium]|nr:hypothetical protein [Polyangia bacterium]
MTRAGSFGKLIGCAIVVAVVSGALIMLPGLERPAWAQQSWEPPPPPPPGQGAQPYGAQPAPNAGQPYPGQPYPGQPYYGSPSDSARALAQATADAQADTSGAAWFFAGCLLGVIGLIIALVVEPSPPPARLMGKSPEYIAIYTTTYKSEGKSAQLRSTLYGLGTAVVVVLVIYIVLVVAFVKSANSTENVDYILRP